MRQLIYFFCVLLLGSLTACKKQIGILPAEPISSITVINAMPNSQPIIPVFGIDTALEYFINAQMIGYTNAQVYSPVSGSDGLYIVQESDTSEIGGKLEMFNGTLKLQAGGIYSFFLAGDTIQTDTLFIQDNIPNYSDSSAGVRFVNLATGSEAISVNIQGNLPTQTEFSNLNYKNVSNFNKYAANSNVPNSSYVFEIRDQGNDSLLLTWTWNYTLFKCNTLVISGSENALSLTPLQVFQVNNY